MQYFLQQNNQVLRYYILNNFIALFKNNNLRKKLLQLRHISKLY
jgi:hypothetical protein